PNMDQTFWTASSHTMWGLMAWSFNGSLGLIDQDDRQILRSVRCLARPDTLTVPGITMSIASMAYRKDDSTIKLAGLNPVGADSRPQPLLFDETSANTA